MIIEKRSCENSISIKEIIDTGHWHGRKETWVRSRTSAGQFNFLAIIRNHKTLTYNLNLRDVANEFVLKSDSGRVIFGQF